MEVAFELLIGVGEDIDACLDDGTDGSGLTEGRSTPLITLPGSYVVLHLSVVSRVSRVGSASVPCPSLSLFIKAFVKLLFTRWC